MNALLRVLAPATLFLAPCLALAACGSSDSPAASGGATGSAGAPGNAAGSSGSANTGAAGAGDSSLLVGSFQVTLKPDATTNILGKIYDGPIPVATIWEKPQVDGACTLTTPRIPFCNTACGGSGVCVEDDRCMAYPTAHGVGTVTVTGVKTTDDQSTFTMVPIANNYQPTASIAYPPFADGDAVKIAAAGDFFPAFAVSSKGIAPLELTSTELALKSGQALDLAWTKGAAGNSTIHVKLDISHHGGSKGQIECDADDTGSLSISSTLVGKLLALGVAGYPTVIVTRQATGSTTISAGRVELVVSSVVEQAVAIDGLTSCTKNNDCAEGQTCQDDLTCK